MTPNFLAVFRSLIFRFILPIIIWICAYIKTRHCFESTSMVDAICLMLHGCYCKYSPFVLPLFARTRMEVDEGLEFTTSPTNGRSKSIEMDVGTNPRIEFEVNGVVRLLIPSMKLCQRFKTLRMACPSIDFKHTNISSFCKISTLTMFPATFLSRFLPKSPILGNPTYMEHKQPSTLH